MARTLPRSLVSAVAAASLVGGCAHYAPEPMAAHDHAVVDVAGEHPHLNRASGFCTEHEVLCILAGFAVLGGAVAAIKSSD